MADVQRGSAGTYTCTATNSYYDGSLGVGVKRARLDVQYPPDVSFPQDSILCKEGDNITLECHVTANPVANTVNLSKDGQVKSLGAVFDIKIVNRSDDGQYTCTAVNTFYDQTEGAGSKDIYVTVEHLPDVIVGGPEEAIMEYTGTTMSCGIIGGLPNPYQIALMKMGQTGAEVIAMSTNTSGVTELTYDVPAAKREMNGTYYCNVTTRFYDQSESYQRSDNIDVIVQYPPELVDITESSIDVKLGERAELTCVVDAYPVAEVVWTDANGDVVESEETVEGTVLTSKIILDKVDKKTLGSYHCNFANDISNGTAHEKRLGKITTPGSMEWFIDTGIIYAIIVGVIILILIIILIVCCCTRKSDKEKEMSVSERRSQREPPKLYTENYLFSISDLAALKRPPADVTSKEGTENLGMVRTAPDGTVNRKGSRNETSLTTFRPQTREDIDRAERMRKLSDDV
ncbi:neurotrimin-like [Ptychodera flava]|uniref:neurotrimin-like n=1 Tax=Ptychodera flava TaxID=63121 RepID=UPI003969F875